MGGLIPAAMDRLTQQEWIWLFWLYIGGMAAIALVLIAVYRLT